MQTTERLFELAKYLRTLLFFLAFARLFLNSNPSSLSVIVNLTDLSMEVNSDFVSEESVP